MSQLFVYRCIILVVLALIFARDRIIYDVDSISIDQPTWQIDNETEDLFNSCSWNAGPSGGQQSLVVTVDSSYNEDIIRDHFNQFLKVISRFDCRDESRYRYSMIWKCHDCKVAYLLWLYLSTSTIRVNGSNIKPCLNVCHRVLQRCPYLSRSIQQSYDGEPAFDCPSKDAILAQDNNGYALRNCVTYNEYAINDEDLQSSTCEENTTCYTFNTTNQLLENNFTNTENTISTCHHIFNRSWYELSLTTSMINSGASISRYSLYHSFILFITLLITIT